MQVVLPFSEPAPSPCARLVSMDQVEVANGKIIITTIIIIIIIIIFTITIIIINIMI